MFAGWNIDDTVNLVNFDTVNASKIYARLKIGQCGAKTRSVSNWVPKIDFLPAKTCPRFSCFSECPIQFHFHSVVFVLIFVTSCFYRAKQKGNFLDPHYSIVTNKHFYSLLKFCVCYNANIQWRWQKKNIVFCTARQAHEYHACV